MACDTSVINSDAGDFVNWQFNPFDNLILSMQVHIIKKQISHITYNPHPATTLCRQKEDYCVRELGPAAPYGFNDK